ncbi:MAG TPA: calcium-binding protein [Rhizomicrobium sp.]|jgi:Ca2+-binding RTX toxin-like protein|nr:calcium-binding protein [Rhizomicrobium sp.]
MTTTIIKDTNSIAESGNGDTGIDMSAGDTAFVLSTGSIIESGTNSIGINIALNNGDNATVDVEGFVYANGTGIQGFGQNEHVTVNGTVASSLYAMYLGGDHAHVTIGATGQVDGSLVLNGNFSDVHNNGLITADSKRTAIYLGASGVWNTGTISSEGDAIHFQGASTGSITNTGMIVGDLSEEPVISPTAALNVYNSGQWMAQQLTLTDGLDTFVNTGEITGAIYLGAGDDSYQGSAGHTYAIVYGGDGNDTLQGGTEDNAFDGGTGRDAIDGGGGANTAQYNASAAGVVVDLSTGVAKYGDAAGDHLTHIQNLTGSLNDDKLTGDNGSNVLNGLVGHDKLFGNDGNDTLIELGGNGKTVMDGGNGDDLLQLTDFDAHTYGNSFGAGAKITGGAGFDTVELRGDYASGVNFNATTMQGVEYLQLDAGFDYKLTTNNATVAAGQTMEIDASQLDATHILTFNGAAETDGNFIIDGGDGKDVMTGGAGSDTFYGGLGVDKITSGLGHDVFVFNDPAEGGRDQITDFDANNDVFLLPTVVTGIDSAVGGNVNSANFANSVANDVAGHLLADHAILVTATGGNLSGHTFLVVDANGAAGYQSAGDYVVDVTGMTGSLTTNDFITG